MAIFTINTEYISNPWYISDRIWADPNSACQGTQILVYKSGSLDEVNVGDIFYFDPALTLPFDTYKAGFVGVSKQVNVSPNLGDVIIRVELGELDGQVLGIEQQICEYPSDPTGQYTQIFINGFGNQDSCNTPSTLEAFITTASISSEGLITNNVTIFSDELGTPLDVESLPNYGSTNNITGISYIQGLNPLYTYNVSTSGILTLNTTC